MHVVGASGVVAAPAHDAVQVGEDGPDPGLIGGAVRVAPAHRVSRGVVVDRGPGSVVRHRAGTLDVLDEPTPAPAVVDRLYLSVEPLDQVGEHDVDGPLAPPVRELDAEDGPVNDLVPAEHGPAVLRGGHQWPAFQFCSASTRARRSAISPSFSVSVPLVCSSALLADFAAEVAP